MKSVRLQLLVTLAAIVVAAAFFVARGLPPSRSLWNALLANHCPDVSRILKWGVSADAANDRAEDRFALMLDEVNTGAHFYLAHRKPMDCCNTPLGFAAHKEYRDMAELLITHGADVNAESPLGEPLLLRVIRQGQEDFIRLLLAHGAKVDVTDVVGRTPLHVAVLYGHKDIAELLVAHGADMNTKDRWGQTPLRLAIMAHEGDIAALLRRHGARE